MAGFEPRPRGRQPYVWHALERQIDNLAERLISWDQEKVPWAQVAARLYEKTGLKVSAPTARRLTIQAYEKMKDKNRL